MFNSRFLKRSSYAVLSASIVSIAHGANGFAQVELENKENATCGADGKNVLSSSFKQEELKINDVNSVNDIKDLKQQGLEKDTKEKEENKKKDRRIWPWVVFGIPAVFFIVCIGYIFLFFKAFFNCGTEKFKKLDFRKKIEMILSFDHDIESLKKSKGLWFEEQFDAFVRKYGKCFDLKRFCLLFWGLDFEKAKEEVEKVKKNREQSYSKLHLPELHPPK